MKVFGEPLFSFFGLFIIILKLVESRNNTYNSQFLASTLPSGSVCNCTNHKFNTLGLGLEPTLPFGRL